MSFEYRRRGVKMSRCTACDADLLVRTDGKLYCSNDRCKARNGHPSLKHTTMKSAA